MNNSIHIVNPLNELYQSNIVSIQPEQRWKMTGRPPAPAQSNYPDTEPTSPCPILITISAWPGNDKYKLSSHWFDWTRVQTHGFESHDLPPPATFCHRISELCLGAAWSPLQFFLKDQRAELVMHISTKTQTNERAEITFFFIGWKNDWLIIDWWCPMLRNVHKNAKWSDLWRSNDSRCWSEMQI